MVAIGSLHESLKQRIWTRNSASLKPEEPPFALQQCNKAIGLLVGANAKAPRSALLLTCIVLFMAFDLMQNNVDSSINQLQHACAILDAWRFRRDKSATSSETDLVEEHILPIVARFSDSWCMQNPGTAALCSVSDAHVRDRALVQALPRTFMSLQQAQSSLHHLLDGLNTTNPGHRPAENGLKQALKDPTLSLLTQWRQQYQQFVDSLGSQDLRPSIRRRLTLLELHYTTAKLLYKMRQVDNEMAYDTEMDTFRSMVRQCEAIVRIEEEIAPTSEPKVIICFDLGIIVPLYLTASRCRHSDIRRKALALLTNFPRREGIWLSWMMAIVMQQVIDIEEHGLQNPQSCKDVPLSSRIELLEMYYNPCPITGATNERCYAPVLRLTWKAAAGSQDANRESWDITQKTIQLPKTRDEGPGLRPYWVVMPEGGHSSSPKLLLGKKTFVAPPPRVPENIDETIKAINVASSSSESSSMT